MRTANPTLNDNVFSRFGEVTDAREVMSIEGTVNKAGFMLLLLLLSSLWTWHIYFKSRTPEAIIPWLLIGTIGGLIVALITTFKRQWSPITAPIYSLLEGLALGAISAFFESQFHGLVIQAVGLTFGTLFCLLFAYKSGLIRATENFKLGVVAATGGIALVYLITFILGLFKVQVPFIHESGIIGIGFSLFVVVIAALNLVLDFDFIENGANHGAPKYMEWYAAFGLMVTLVWLYIEILRLLSKLAGRKR